MATRKFFPAFGLRARCLWLNLGWTLVLLVIHLSLAPAPFELPVQAGDKLSHVFAYLVLMSWFANLYEGPVHRFRFAIGFLALGVTLEILQRWIGYRSFEVIDMAANAAGVAVGWVLAPPRLPNYLKFIENCYERYF